MAHRHGRLAFLFLASFGLVIGILVTDAAVARRAFRFADVDPLVISTDTWPPEVEPVLLWNSTGRVRFLRARVALSGLPREARATTLRVFGRVRLPARGSAVLEIHGDQGHVPEPETYPGTLTVWEVPTGAVIHKRVELNVMEPAPTTGSPLVSEYAFTMYRSLFYVPVGHLSKDQARLPLDVKEAGTEPISPPPEGTVLGILLRSGGEGALKVSSTGETSELIDDVPGLELSLDGSYVAGTYKGTVDLLPDDDEAGETTLTVVIKDWPLLPLLALVLGVAVAWLIQRFTGVRARISGLRSQTARTMDSINAADEAFRRDVDGRSFNVPRIVQCLREAARQVDADLRAVERSFFFVLDEQDRTYKGALSNMKTLEEQASVWRDFGKKLVVLDDALKPLREAGDREQTRPPGLDPTVRIRPALLKRAEEVLRPATVPDRGIDLKTLPALAESVEKWTVLARAWVEVDAQLDDLKQWADLLRADAATAERPDDHWTEEERKSLRSLDGLFGEVRWDLWYAVDPGDFLARETGRDVDRIEQIIARLSYHLRPEEEALQELLDAQPQMSFLVAPRPLGSRLKGREPVWRNLLADVRREPSEPAARALWLEQRVRTWTRVIFVLLLVGAIYLGMQTVYVGKPFGTPLDYAGALTWGLASKLTLDAVASALDGVRRASVPLPL